MKRVLVVDDQANLKESLCGFFSLRGWCVVWSVDPEDCFARLQKDDRFSLLLCDIDLATRRAKWRLAGLDIIMNFKRVCPHVTAWAYSAMPAAEVKMRAREAGASRFFRRDDMLRDRTFGDAFRDGASDAAPFPDVICGDRQLNALCASIGQMNAISEFISDLEQGLPDYPLEIQQELFQFEWPKLAGMIQAVIAGADYTMSNLADPLQRFHDANRQFQGDRNASRFQAVSGCWRELHELAAAEAARMHQALEENAS